MVGRLIGVSNRASNDMTIPTAFPFCFWLVLITLDYELAFPFSQVLRLVQTLHFRTFDMLKSLGRCLAILVCIVTTNVCRSTSLIVLMRSTTFTFLFPLFFFSSGCPLPACRPSIPTQELLGCLRMIPPAVHGVPIYDEQRLERVYEVLNSGISG